MPTPLPAAAATVAPNLHATQAEEAFYPCSDGKPMTENMWQFRAIVSGTRDIESAHPGALVAGDILIYPEEGNRDNKIGPDVLVALGLGTHNRSSYFVWREGKPPDWVLEVASPGTQVEDRRDKPSRYAKIGVPEYWLFDPRGNVYPRGTPRLQGFKLVDGEYRPLESRLMDGERTIRSEVLGLDVRIDGEDGELLRFRDVATGRDIRHQSEIEADEKRAKARAEREAAQRKAAEARAEWEAAQRKAAEARAETAEARIAELEAALARSQHRTPP